MLAALLGISPAQEAEIKSWTKNGGFQNLSQNFQCAAENLSALRQLFEREYGMPKKPDVAVAFNVQRRPAMPIGKVSGTDNEEFDLESELGKPVTRGHIKCQFDSDSAVQIFFGIKDQSTKKIVYSEEYYRLEPSGVLDFSWEFDAIQIKSDNGGQAIVQILAQ